MKRIVVCCDGTWNGADQKVDGKLCPTNIGKLLKLIDTGTEPIPQFIVPIDGVGYDEHGLAKIVSGITGSGLDRKLLAGYRAIVQNYETGDEIYLLGFSRGSFTARSIGGMIVNVGILKREHLGMMPEALAMYRSRDPNNHPRGAESDAFRARCSVADRTPIKCIGVFDTVGSLGNPLKRHLTGRFKFHDLDLSSTVAFAYHAIAIDEHRKAFRPTLWAQTCGGKAAGQVLEQRWFAGAHRDAGGGRPEAGLSNIALDWMIEKLTGTGLRIHPMPAEWRTDLTETPEDTMTLFYRTLGGGSADRAIDDEPALRAGRAAIARDQGKTAPPAGFHSSFETVDRTAISKLSTPDYRPRNLAAWRARPPKAGTPYSDCG